MLTNTCSNHSEVNDRFSYRPLFFLQRMKNIKLITIDATNTIFRFKEPPPAIYQRFAVKHQVSCESKTLVPKFLKSFSNVNQKWSHFGATAHVSSRDWWYEVIYGTFEGHDKSKVKPLAKDLYEYYETSEPYLVYKDFEPFAQHWKDISGRGLVVISNYDRRLPKILDNLDLVKYFDDIITSEEAKASKPEARIFNLALLRSKYIGELNEVLHIGDDFEKDYKGALNMGWEGAMIKRQESFDDFPEHATYSSFHEISEAFLGSIHIR